MRLLLDECIDERLRHMFVGHDCRSVRYAGLAGLKNGKLLAAAEASGFDVFITVDQGIPYQQNLETSKVSIVVLFGRTNRLRDLERLVPPALEALSSITPGQVVSVR